MEPRQADEGRRIGGEFVQRKYDKIKAELATQLADSQLKSLSKQWDNEIGFKNQENCCYKKGKAITRLRQNYEIVLLVCWGYKSYLRLEDI